MGEAGPRAEFIPFVPRRLEPKPAESGGDTPAASEHLDEFEQPLKATPAPVEEGAVPETPGQENQADTAESAAAAADDVLEPQAAPLPLAPRPCQHESLIRNEAIRLAVVACGRALRRTALIHPEAVATFVDDALAAAGRPRDAEIACEEDEDECAIRVTSSDVLVWSDISTRAELLVRAAAET